MSGRDRAKTASRLLGAGAAAAPVFISTYTIAGALRPGYSARRHPVSTLALGPGGWVQRANFAVTGSLYIAGAVGHRLAAAELGDSPLSPVALGAIGAGLVSSGVFATDPISGYPPGTPDQPDRPSSTGSLHMFSALPIFFGIPGAGLACARALDRAGDRRWAAYSAGSAALMAVNFVLSSVGFGQHRRLVAYGGAFQRAAITIGFGWLTAICLRQRRRLSERS